MINYFPFSKHVHNSCTWARNPRWGREREFRDLPLWDILEKVMAQSHRPFIFVKVNSSLSLTNKIFFVFIGNDTHKVWPEESISSLGWFFAVCCTRFTAWVGVQRYTVTIVKSVRVSAQTSSHRAVHVILCLALRHTPGRHMTVSGRFHRGIDSQSMLCYCSACPRPTYQFSYGSFFQFSKYSKATKK